MLRSRRVAFRAEMIRISSPSSSTVCATRIRCMPFTIPIGLPTHFTLTWAFDLAVLHGDVKRIVKDVYCCFEADAMFALVGPVLALVAGKFHIYSAITNMYIQ